MRIRKITSFTLAEVLITLVVIGIIAALTIPALISHIDKIQYTAKLKKEYSVISQAYLQIIQDASGSILNNSHFSCSGSIDDCEATAPNALNDFAAKLNVIKNCGSGMGCFYTSSRRFLGGGVNEANYDSAMNGMFAKAILADGTMIAVEIYNNQCTNNFGTPDAGSPIANSQCGNIKIDVNGSAGPNQIGRDFFYFWITQKGIYPQGVYNDDFSCVINSSSDATSYGCAGKVLTEGSMNY